MTSREIQAKLAHAMRVIACFETSLRYRDTLSRAYYDDEAERALFDLRDRYPDGGQP